MSGINNITLSYQEYKSYVGNNKNSKLANRSYSMDLENGQNKEKILGSAVCKNAKAGISYEMKAVYDDSFTSDSPLIKVTTNGTDKKMQEYVINIDEIDVSDASEIEMFALCSYADAHEKRTENSKSYWDSLKEFVTNTLSEMPSENTYGESYEQKCDWLAMVEKAKDDYMEAKQYKQVTDGNQLTYLLEKYGMPKEVEMIRIDDNTLVPVNNGIKVQDVDGGYAQMLFDSNGEISYVNNLNQEAGWNMKVSQDMLKKAQNLGSEFAMFMSDKTFWENFLNRDICVDDLKKVMDYKKIRTDYLDNLPESVKQAWEDAATKAGVDGLGIGENGELLYPSAFARQYMLAKLKDESTELYDNTKESVLQFARRTLSYLEDAHQPKYNANLQSWKDKEVIFYQSLRDNLE